MNHPREVEGYPGNLQKLVEDIGDLDYDVLVEFFDLLSKKFHRDSIHDMEIGHPQVSEKLKAMSDGLRAILEEIVRLANMCRGYNERGIK